ncbi:MAG: FAD-dependent oxidoreductase [Lachnospiraceae bacterium]|nr:FAD-dependent oxidoreductase [Lachnospiraceae bacterium]
MLRLNQIKLDISHNEEDLLKAIADNLKVKQSKVKSYKIIKKSVDARKDNVKYVYCIDAEVFDEDKILQRLHKKDIMKSEYKEYVLPMPGNEKSDKRIIIAGFGPAGIFCAYALALRGYKPVVIERGADVDTRKSIVNRFFTAGELNTECNVQFGEGGAGTFSDGKLNTLIKDKEGRGKFVLETFVKFGANPEITYINKPHIGTDVLSDIVKNMRKEIINLGGEVRFNSKLSEIHSSNGHIEAVTVVCDGNKYDIETDTLVLAIGHSARDTFYMLKDENLNMESKAFAVGVRIEHNQKMIQEYMYKSYADKLPAADYKVTYQAGNGRGVYSFCMCPGGYVVNASSEKEMLAINGMSYSKRDGINANSAMVVTVNPEDYGGSGPLSGVEFQRKLERLAYRECNGKVVVQLFDDYVNNRISKDFGSIMPQIKGEYGFGNINNILPEFINVSLKEGIKACNQRIPGFAADDAVLSGVESRTSSPVRINRDELYESNIKGIYPCGEGAGYAGGITSAAIDGLKVAEKIIERRAV